MTQILRFDPSSSCNLSIYSFLFFYNKITENTRKYAQIIAIHATANKLSINKLKTYGHNLYVKN